MAKRTTTPRARKAAPKPSATQPAYELVDHKYFFDTEVEMGFTTRLFNDLVALHKNGATYLKNSLGANTAFEIGSGLGFFLIGAKAIGLDAVGMDINPFERDFAISKEIDPDRYILAGESGFQIPGNYDAIYSVEVFEHIPDFVLIPLIQQIADKCKWFYFTSTPHATTPEQDKAWGHINLKPKQGWIELFEQHGLTFHADSRVITEWGMLFKGKL